MNSDNLYTLIMVCLSVIVLTLSIVGVIVGTGTHTETTPPPAEVPHTEVEPPEQESADEQESPVEPPHIEEPAVPEPVLPDIEAKYEEEIIYLAKTVWGEARGCSTTEQAAVVWCILNRVDRAQRDDPRAIIDVITRKNQFVGYSENHPVDDSIRTLVIDVLTRWEREKAGETDVGRVLPKDYLYFVGDGKKNIFRNEYRGGETWDWTLESPY